MMKKNLLIIILFVFISIIYLNRTYAHIYNKIGSEYLKSPDIKKKYTFNEFSNQNLKYIAIGDSLTAGVGATSYEKFFPYKVAQKISEKGESVVLETMAIPGAKTADVLNKLDTIISQKPEIITVLIGVNDIHSQISIENFKNNYEIILKKLIKNTNTKIYLINLPYIGDSKLILPPWNYIFDIKTQEFNKIIKELANKYSLGYIDLYSETIPQKIQSGSYYSSDLFHPSDDGYELWSKIIYDYINK